MAIYFGEEPKDGIQISDKKPSPWISVKERLPEEGQEVFAYAPNMPWPDSYKGKICRFKRGRTRDEVEQAGIITSEDQHGNNHLPFCWIWSPGKFFGQDVSHWMPLPEKPENT